MSVPFGKDRFLERAGQLRSTGHPRPTTSRQGHFISANSHLELVLDAPKPVYHSGDVVTGRVMLHLAVSEIVLKINVKLKCVSRVVLPVEQKDKRQAHSQAPPARGSWAGVDGRQDVFLDVREDGVPIIPPILSGERSSTLDIVYHDFVIAEGDPYHPKAPGHYTYDLRIVIPDSPSIMPKASAASTFMAHTSRGLIASVIGGATQLASAASSSLSPHSSPLPPGTLLPPSFDLGKYASSRWYLKVTAVKKGLLTPNERLFAPLVYLPFQQIHDEPKREEWVSAHASTAGHGLLFQKNQETQMTLYSPSPLTHPRATSIRYRLMAINTKDRPAVHFIRRVTVTVHALIKVYETVLSTDMPHTNASGGESRGSVQVGSQIAPTFALPNLRVDYALVASLPSLQCVLPITITSGSIKSSEPQAPMDDYGLPPSYFDVVSMDQIDQAGKQGEKK